MSEFPSWHGTTILSVRKGGKVVVAGDGQVSLGSTVVKANAKKVRRLGADGVVIDADTFSPDPQYGSDDTTPPDGAAPIDWWPVPDDDS